MAWMLLSELILHTLLIISPSVECYVSSDTIIYFLHNFKSSSEVHAALIRILAHRLGNSGLDADGNCLGN